MKSTLSSWITQYSSQSLKIIASSKRKKSYPCKKEVVCRIEDGRYKLSRFSKRQDHTLIFSQEEFLQWFLHVPHNWKQCDVFLETGIHYHLRFIDEEGENICFSSTQTQKKGISSISCDTTEGHNRIKNHPFLDGVPFQPFIDLGLQEKNGKVKSSMLKKFHQINGFLTLIKPTIDHWMATHSEVLHIFDMGCGKGYITHALAAYFSQIHPHRIRVTGIDSRSDIIASAQKAIVSNNISFSTASIGKAETIEMVHTREKSAVIALHACNTATDVALIQAYNMRSDLFFVAPCCHHEISTLLEKKYLLFMQRHPIFHQKFSALITDSLRSSIMEFLGWDVDALEFIDPEHTPQNILLRGVYTGNRKKIPCDIKNIFENMKQKPLLYRTLII